MALAGPLESLRFFCGDCENRGFVRTGGAGVIDCRQECFSPVRVRCGKKKQQQQQRNFVEKLAQVQALVKVHRELVLLSSTDYRARDPIGDVVPEDSIQIAVSNPSVLEQMIKNLEDLQAEVESLNVKSKKKKNVSPSYFAPGTGDSEMANAADIHLPFKSKKSGKHTRAPSASDNFNSGAPSATEAMSSVMLPRFHSTEQITSSRTSSDGVQEEEPAIVAQIRALCSSAAHSPTRDLFTRGPIELRETPGGRVIVDTNSSSSLSSLVHPTPAPTTTTTRGTIEVCTAGKCRKGGSLEILASLQGSYDPESSSVSVTACKCLGKCKSAPNVRLTDREGRVQLHSHVSVDGIDALIGLHFDGQLRAWQ